MKKLLLILLLSPLFFTVCYAEGLEEQAAELMGTDALEQALTPEERQIGGTLRLDGLYDTAGALDRLWSSAVQTVKDAFTREIRTVAALAVIAVFAALSAALVQNPTMESVINTAACAVVAGQTVGSLDRWPVSAARLFIDSPTTPGPCSLPSSPPPQPAALPSLRLHGMLRPALPWMC